MTARLEALGSVAVAFSGGVDSGVLLHAARRVLGDAACGVVADSASLPRAELAAARAFAAGIGARLVVVRTDELDDPRYRANAGDRCFHCKSALFAAMGFVAEREGLSALAFGEITDDLLDDRPGARAAREHAVCAPLREAGLSKADVRRYAREEGLALAEKPASACLASRIPRGTEVTRARLAAVERAEVGLRALGIGGVLRVRHRGRTARVEVDAERLAAVRERREEVLVVLRGAGFEDAELGRYGVRAER